ncbi:MAG: Ig-like domain-containing protein, partial [Clostridia bacterium]|nr:Ig-like domain-containing protein [Clostridia bacterium]
MKKKIVSIFLALMLILSTAFMSGCDPDVQDPVNPPDTPPSTPSAEYYVNFRQINVTLNKGDSVRPQLIFTADGDNASVSLLTFESDNPSVAVVDATGQILAVGGGNCNIIASIGTGENKVGDSIFVTVNEYGVVFVEKNYSINYAEQVQLVAKAYYNGVEQIGSTCAYTSSNENVAKIVDGQFVKGTGEGTATITASYMGATDTATVTVGIPEFSILLSEENYIVDSAQPLTIRYQALAGTIVDDNPQLQWHIADTSVATVSNGVVTGLKDGTTTLTVNYHGMTDTATIKVVKTVASSLVNSFN